jgi:hypothetical protein
MSSSTNATAGKKPRRFSRTIIFKKMSSQPTGGDAARHAAISRVSGISDAFV